MEWGKRDNDNVLKGSYTFGQSLLRDIHGELFTLNAADCADLSLEAMGCERV